MLRFLIRRILGAVAVLFAISILVFLIFNVVPATNPAQRIAGKNATPTLIKSFKTGDVVDLSHLDPNFHIVSQFDGHAHELMVQQIGTGNWMVYGDTTGAGVANFEIHLTNVQSPLMAGNFHL